MVDSKENYKFNLGVKGLKKKRGFNKPTKTNNKMEQTQKQRDLNKKTNKKTRHIMFPYMTCLSASCFK